MLTYFKILKSIYLNNIKYFSPISDVLLEASWLGPFECVEEKALFEKQNVAFSMIDPVSDHIATTTNK